MVIFKESYGRFKSLIQIYSLRILASICNLHILIFKNQFLKKTMENGKIRKTNQLTNLFNSRKLKIWENNHFINLSIIKNSETLDQF